ncbi:glutamate mutase L [Asanoa ferruginea]
MRGSGAGTDGQAGLTGHAGTRGSGAGTDGQAGLTGHAGTPGPDPGTDGPAGNLGPVGTHGSEVAAMGPGRSALRFGVDTPEAARNAAGRSDVDAEFAVLEAAAAARAATPGFVPSDDAERAIDRRIAALAATIAVRRHARGPAGRAGRDLRDARLLVGSGGVLRHATPGEAKEVLDAVLTDFAGGWAVPRAATPVIDVSYVLAAAGLLAADHPNAARALLDRHLRGA